LFTILLLLIGGGVFLFIRSRRPKPLEIRTSKAEVTGQLRQLVNASGEIRTHEMVDIQTEIAGVIVELPVKEGQTITKGQTLLKIDPFQAQMSEAGARGQFEQGEAEIRRMEAGIATARANLARQREAVRSAEALLNQAQVTVERDQNSLKRYERLLETKAISRDQFEIIEARARISAAQVDSSRAALDQAKAQLKASDTAINEQQAARDATVKALSVNQAQLSRASDELSKATITSPLDGVIVRLNVDIGERAVPGIQSNPQATLMTLANLSTIEAELQVDEVDIIDVRLSDTATVKVDALPNKELTGRVTEISQAPIQRENLSNNNQEGKDFKVVITVDAPPPALRIGMSCEAEILVAERKNILTVPIQALTAREVKLDEKGKYIPPPRPLKPGQPTANETKTTGTKETQGVFVRGSDDMAHFRPIKTGIMGESTVEVLEGIKAGEEVITGPLAVLRQLNEWSLVKLSNGTGGPMGLPGTPGNNK
jgi:HlyD family secretion protein